MSSKLLIFFYMRKILPLVAVGLFMVMIVIKPEYYISSMRGGLALFATAVLPALFPFYFCTTMLTKTGAAESMSKLFGKAVNKVYNAPPQGAYALFSAFLCGYPVGMSVIADLYEANEIDSEGAKKLCTFCSTSGPVFILGTVGAVLFENHIVGIIILISHYLGALTNGLFFRGRAHDAHFNIKTNSNMAMLRNINTDCANAGIDEVLSESVSRSTLAMLMLGGYIVLGNMLIDSLALLPLNLPPEICTWIYGAVEMTRGSMLAAESENLAFATAAATAIISFGGLSVILQSTAFAARCKIKFSSFLIRKICQAGISFLYAFLISIIILK